MAKFGYLDDPALDGFELQPDDRLVVQQYELEEDGTLVAISAYIRGADAPEGQVLESPWLRAVVYEDDGGEPGALLGVSTDNGFISDAQDAKWESNLFESGLELTAGTYWIGVHTQDGGLFSPFVEIGYRDGTGVRRYATDVQTDGSPAVWPTGSDTADAVELSIFAEYIPSASVYDATQHHVGLGYEDITPRYGFLLDGAYRKDVQRDPTPEEFGGERDEIERVPSLARWTQDDFLGGQYAETFLDDNKQFAECSGFIPSQMRRSLVCVPPFVPAILNSDEQTEEPLLFHGWGQYVYRVSTENIQRYDLTDDTLDAETTAAAGWSLKAACFDGATNRIFVLQQNDAGTDIDLLMVNPSSGSVTTVDGSVPSPPANKTARGLVSDNAGNLYGVFGGGKLWRIKPNDDLNDATWREIKKLPEAYQDACVYNGYVYILCGDADQRTVLLVFDGTNLNTLVEIPFNFIGKCLCVYGGRIYVGGAGLDIDGNESYAELYEINGSSLRLIRTWSPTRTSPGATIPTTISDLHVHEGLLFLGCTGLGRVEVYDQTTDAFYGGPQIDATNQNDIEPLALSAVRGKLVSWMRDPTATALDGVWKLCDDEADLLSSDQFAPGIYTSRFDVQPASEKRWSKITLRCKGASPQSIWYYNFDAGTFSGGGATTWQEGEFHFAELDLTHLPPSKDQQFRFLWSVDDLDALPELMSFTVQFTFLDSGKHAWALSVAVPSDIETMDGTTVTQNVDATIQTLEEWQENRQPLVYTDVDGREYQVNIRDISILRPIVGPPVNGTPEALVNVTLIEV